MSKYIVQRDHVWSGHTSYWSGVRKGDQNETVKCLEKSCVHTISKHEEAVSDLVHGMESNDTNFLSIRTKKQVFSTTHADPFRHHTFCRKGVDL